jgi:hypothetical protein
MGKTLAGMCIESIAPERHNVQHQAGISAATVFHPLKGTSNEQF